MEWNGYEARQTPNVDLKVHNVHFDLSFWSNTDQ